MAEKIIYEIALEGIANALNLIGGLENRLSNVKYGGIVALNKELTKTTSLLHTVAALSPTGTKSYDKSIRIGVSPLSKKLVTAGWMGNLSALGRELQSTNVISEIKRAYAAVRSENDRNGVSDILRRMYIPRLTWNGGWEANIDADTRTASEHARERHEYAELKRAGNRAFSSRQYDIVPRGATYGVVPATQTALQRLNAIHFGGEAFGARAGEFGWTPHFSTVGKIVSGFRAFTKVVGFVTKVISPITASIEAIKKVTKALHSFGDLVLRANESWRLLRESHAYGTSMTSLSDAWGRVTQLGGDRASASALWNRWSRERAMLAFGGNGGSLMEAARLFGLNIRGSGEYGFATNDELARNIVKTMSTLTRSQQVAMKNVLGLDDYQFWSMSQGLEFFDELTEKSRTFSQKFAKLFDLDDALFPKAHSKASLEFEGAWAELVRSFEELGAAIGVYLLPVLADLMHFISKIVQLFTWFLNLPRWVFESLERLVNTITGISASTNDAVASTASENEIRVRLNESGRNLGRGDRAVVINIGDISLNSLGLPENATPEQIKRRTGEVIWNQLGDALTDNRR